MIRIVMDGLCDGCKHADLELDCCKYYSGEKEWSVKCIHEDACDSMESRTIERMMMEGEA